MNIYMNATSIMINYKILRQGEHHDVFSNHSVKSCINYRRQEQVGYNFACRSVICTKLGDDEKNAALSKSLGS